MHNQEPERHILLAVDIEVITHSIIHLYFNKDLFFFNSLRIDSIILSKNIYISVKNYKSLVKHCTIYCIYARKQIFYICNLMPETTRIWTVWLILIKSSNILWVFLDSGFSAAIYQRMFVISGCIQFDAEQSDLGLWILFAGFIRVDTEMLVYKRHTDNIHNCK